MAKRTSDAGSNLSASEPSAIDRYLELEGGKLLSGMQAPRARRGARRAFASTPEELGKAAAAAAIAKRTK